MSDSRSDPDKLQILAGLPQSETVFEYLTGCWKRMYRSNRDFHRTVRIPCGDANCFADSRRGDQTRPSNGKSCSKD